LKDVTSDLQGTFVRRYSLRAGDLAFEGMLRQSRRIAEMAGLYPIATIRIGRISEWQGPMNSGIEVGIPP
jgi:hypothetical protein